MSFEEALRSKVRPKAGLIESLDAVAREPRGELDDGLEPVEKLSPLPRPGDPYTLAFASSRHHPVLTIRFLLGNATKRGFPFANLDSVDWMEGEKPGEAPVIVARFHGLIATEVRLEGRHMDTLYDLLGHHKVSWVRELPPGRDFRDAKETVINHITVRQFDPAKQ